MLLSQSSFPIKAYVVYEKPRSLPLLGIVFTLYALQRLMAVARCLYYPCMSIHPKQTADSCGVSLYQRKKRPHTNQSTVKAHALRYAAINVNAHPPQLGVGKGISEELAKKIVPGGWDLDPSHKYGFKYTCVA